MIRALRDTAATVLVLAACVAGCSAPKAEVPARGVVEAALRQEAESLKADGEKIDPALAMKAAWNIEAVEVREKPGDAARPWAGTIRFRIETTMHDAADRKPVTHRMARQFDYAYDAALQRWVIEYAPATPAPARP